MYHEKAERLWVYSHDVTATNSSGATDQIREGEDTLQCEEGISIKQISEADIASPRISASGLA